MCQSASSGPCPGRQARLVCGSSAQMSCVSRHPSAEVALRCGLSVAPKVISEGLCPRLGKAQLPKTSSASDVGWEQALHINCDLRICFYDGSAIGSVSLKFEGGTTWKEKHLEAKSCHPRFPNRQHLWLSCTSNSRHTALCEAHRPLQCWHLKYSNCITRVSWTVEDGWKSQKTLGTEPVPGEALPPPFPSFPAALELGIWRRSRHRESRTAEHLDFRSSIAFAAIDPHGSHS